MPRLIRAVFLSHFDIIEGPKITHSVPAMDKDGLDRFKSVPKLLDVIDKEQFFINTMENIYSANYHFSINSDFIRGNKVLLLLSLVVELSQNDKKEDVLIYLENIAPLLLTYAQQLTSAVLAVDMGGLFSSESWTRVMALLHELHERAFGTKEFGGLVSARGGKIVVVGQDGINPKAVFDAWRVQMLSEVSPDLKTRMAVHVIKEMEFHEFHCPARNSEICLMEECPVCKELGNEADAIIYILEHASAAVDKNAKGLQAYIKGFTKRKDVPFFIFIVVQAASVTGRPDDIAAGLVNTLRGTLAGPRTIDGLHVYALTTGDTVTFKRAMGDLIKLVV